MFSGGGGGSGMEQEVARGLGGGYRWLQVVADGYCCFSLFSLVVFSVSGCGELVCGGGGAVSRRSGLVRWWLGVGCWWRSCGAVELGLGRFSAVVLVLGFPMKAWGCGGGGFWCLGVLVLVVSAGFCLGFYAVVVVSRWCLDEVSIGLGFCPVVPERVRYADTPC